MTARKLLIGLIIPLVFSACSTKQNSENPRYAFNPELEPEVQQMVNSLTLQEKSDLLYGNGKFWSAGVERLGIDDVQYVDGPLGVREELERHTWNPLGLTTDSATFFPAGGGLSATWNTDLAFKYGKAMGAEARARDKDYLLAPAVNIQRSPLGGRNYEYFTEDPLLNIKMAVPMIKGIQSMDVAATIKHFAINNQETNRGSIDVQADERTIREIYLPVYKAAVQDADVYSVMCSYNRFRGAYLCENEYMLQDILKGAWGFQGTVMSDWGATHSTIASAKNGLDIEMGDGEEGSYNEVYFADPLIEAVESGELDEAIVDEKAERIIRVLLNINKNQPNRLEGAINTSEHHQLVYDVASESIVLLKNDASLLPLNPSELNHIAVIGDNATQKMASGGFGAGVKAQYEVTPLEGLKSRLPNTEITFSQGYEEKYDDHQPIGLPYYKANPKLISEAVEAAKEAELAIVFVGGNRLVESESHDRKTMDLPFGQPELIQAVSEANPNTIIVMVAGTPYDLTEVVPATSTLVWSWFNGSEAGNALADVLTGAVNPSGKLPFTIPKKLEDSPAHATNSFPGDEEKVVYEEGLLVGYRWFDTKDIAPMFPFGFGLSYTAFEYGEPTINKKAFEADDKIELKIPVTNTGDFAGKEIVQVYVEKPNSEVVRPQKELKGFSKVEIGSGESTSSTVKIPIQNLAYFDVSEMTWKVEPGNYLIHVGSSSKDIHSTLEIAVN